MTDKTMNDFGGFDSIQIDGLWAIWRKRTQPQCWTKKTQHQWRVYVKAKSFFSARKVAGHYFNETDYALLNGREVENLNEKWNIISRIGSGALATVIQETPIERRSREGLFLLVPPMTPGELRKMIRSSTYGKFTNKRTT